MPNVFVSADKSAETFERFLKIFIPLCAAAMIFFLGLAVWVSSI